MQAAFKSFRSLFGKTAAEERSEDGSTLVGPRIPRHSTGWGAMLKHLREGECLRVLDVGPTSSSNINFLTNLGHSIYMADIVTEAKRDEWLESSGEDQSGGAAQARVRAFLDQNLEFPGRVFDVILLWTTLDYLPPAFIEPVIARLHANLNEGGRILTFFHTKTAGPEAIFYRYHVTDGDSVEMQEAERIPVRQVYTNRKIETLFSAYRSCRFFLAKDNVYEVIVNR